MLKKAEKQGRPQGTVVSCLPGSCGPLGIY